MSRRALQPRSNVCQLCDFILLRHAPTKRPMRHERLLNPPRTFSTGRRLYKTGSLETPSRSRQAIKASSSESIKQEKSVVQHATEADLQKALLQVKATCNKLISLDRVPSEQETLQAIAECDAMAKLLVLESPSASGDKMHGATSALLSLDDAGSRVVQPHKVPPTTQKMIEELSMLAYSVVTHPPVFISPAVLDMYVSIQASLGTPETLSEILYLYANKPIAQEGTSPIRYSNANPNKPASAVPPITAERALQAAINAKKLVTAMDIIQASYTTPAYHWSKFIRRGLLPVTAAIATPGAVYTVASQIAPLQTTMDTAMFTKVAFTGGLAYLSYTTAILIIAITTANDNMKRVTWAPGVPLRERWMREEERAAIDKVAVAWGFREVWRRGEEEGEDWDLLREWIGGKAMMLDRVELMEGME